MASCGCSFLFVYVKTAAGNRIVKGTVAFRCRSRDFVLALLLGTVESKIAAKKTHKMEKSAEKIGGFPL